MDLRPRWRVGWTCGVLSALAIVSRTALDWFVPPETFYLRATVTTFTAIALFTAAGFWTTWQTRSLRAGVAAGMLTAAVSAAFVLSTSLMLFLARHDPVTLSAIEWSGGLSEVFTLPIIMALPGAVLAFLGGVIGKAVAALQLRLS